MITYSVYACSATYVHMLCACAVFFVWEYFRTFISHYFECATGEQTFVTCTFVSYSVRGKQYARTDATLHTVCKRDTSAVVNKDCYVSKIRIMTETPEQFSYPEVCHVAVRLPPFWPDRPAIWFATQNHIARWQPSHANATTSSQTDARHAQHTNAPCPEHTIAQNPIINSATQVSTPRQPTIVAGKKGHRQWSPDLHLTKRTPTDTPTQQHKGTTCN